MTQPEQGFMPDDSFGTTRAGLKASALLNRKNWKMTWDNVMDVGGLPVGEKVNSNDQIKLLKQL